MKHNNYNTELLGALKELLSSVTNEYTDLHVSDRKAITRASKAIQDMKEVNYKDEDAIVRAMLIEYGIIEVTTNRQKKNGTREFEFPVPAWTDESYLAKAPKLRLACFKSGYVRNQNSCYNRAYQINKINRVKIYYYRLVNGKNIQYSYYSQPRVLLFNGIDRLMLMLDYYLKRFNK